MDIDYYKILELFNQYHKDSELEVLTFEYLKFFTSKIFETINKPKITDIHVAIEKLGFTISYEIMKYINENILDFDDINDYRNLTLKYAILYFYIKSLLFLRYYSFFLSFL